MKYIYIIAGWFGYKRAHSAISADILSTFTKAVNDLEEHQAAVKKTIDENQAEVERKLAENFDLNKLSEKQAKIASNIRGLVGE